MSEVVPDNDNDNDNDNDKKPSPYGYCEYCWADYGPNFEITHNVPPGERCWGEA